MDEKANNDVVLSREEFDLESVFSWHLLFRQ
jgi:hypothetical protein